MTSALGHERGGAPAIAHCPRHAGALTDPDCRRDGEEQLKAMARWACQASSGEGWQRLPSEWSTRVGDGVGDAHGLELAWRKGVAALVWRILLPSGKVEKSAAPRPRREHTMGAHKR